MLKEEAMHLGAEVYVLAHVLDLNGKKTPLNGLLITGAVLIVITKEKLRRLGFDKEDLINSRI